MKRFIKLLLVLMAGAGALGVSSCKKYLDKQPDKTLIIPHTLSDLQTLLDNYDFMNQRNSGVGEIIAGDIYATSSDWASVYSIDARSLYIWDKDANLSNAWTYLYKPVSYSNIVLDGLGTINSTADQAAYNDAKGQALFFRSFYFWQLAQFYCKPYSPTAASDLGIVLRLTSDINVPSIRSTVQQTYDQIIADLKQAVPLLPMTSISPVRPDRTAAYALLARVFLSMNEYVNAGKYADSSLKIKSTLLDYNSINSSAAQPIPKMNREVLFHAIGGEGTTIPPFAKIDSALYSSYDDNDLRKQVFFQTNVDNSHSFKGSYGSETGSIIFHGIAVDEMYLIRAESAARAGNKDAALADLNTLLQKRWKNSVVYPTITAVDASGALQKILSERRKELLYRSLRWSDLRRLNLTGASITLERRVNGTTYSLPPNDLRWVLLIPVDIIRLSGIQQNSR